MSTEAAELTQSLASLDLTGAIYTSEKTGSDETGDGSEAKPFKTVARGIKGLTEPYPHILVDGKDESKGKFELVSKTAIKNAKKVVEIEAKKRGEENRKRS